MLRDSHIKIPLEKDGRNREVKTLCWRGDTLVDYVGINKFELSGEIISGNINYAYRFDRAISFADGTYSVLFENYGTKGLILKEDNFIREINRSYYCANAYEYPVTIFTSDEDRICLAHCPDEYNILEIEDVETGERLTFTERESHDFFHSRLEVTPNGKYLLSAGWVWHPVDMVEIYDLTNISAPDFFNLYHDDELGLLEINSATFVENSVIVVTGSEDENENKRYICAYDIENRKLLSKVKLSAIAGNLMAIDENFVVGFYENPKLINVQTGKVERQWTEIFSGKQNSSINPQNGKNPPIAINFSKKRFAIPDKDFIHIISFEK